ncbi:sugar-binding transcriptional regulator [Neptunicella marina]|uniref:Sugar-binding transcriptional regulator n=1 Tax=Neptunicella marina TaxID=2125989 RepID=A0A8J6ISD4_9ALTE|nr:sugar-binding transcriptional regulator [Neptunicella marina]MBC3765529.1 sugar-binding transcriptional regulator [Neptunicella marina]
MSTLPTNDSRRLDDVARAGWLYHVAGNTQDDIAKKLGVSRQSVQRLVALAVSAGLIKVRLDHPIARCMELSHRIMDRFGLLNCEVVPSEPADPSSIIGLAQAGAAEMERYLKAPEPQIVAMGTGRVLRACAEELPPMDCQQHSIVSLIGNIMEDGSASAYDVVVRVADRVKAKYYPMPLPVFCPTAENKSLLLTQPHIQPIFDLGDKADATFVGIGNLGISSPLFLDGFVNEKEMQSLHDMGGVGEMLSWVFDRQGTIIDCDLNRRVSSKKLNQNSDKPVVAIAAGELKVHAIMGAMRSGLINKLITNEYTAELILRND